MRAWVLVMTLTMMTGAAFAAPRPAKPAAPAKPAVETTWIAVCFGEDNAQYTQIINGAGYFHLGTGQRTYQTQKLVQSYYDGTKVCAIADPKAPRADSNVAEVCADLTAKTIAVMSFQTAETKPAIPQNTTVFCTARIDVLP